MRVLAYTCFALVAFAANSILCRLALASGSIDPASFTIVRLASGALMLLMFVLLKDRKWPPLGSGSWPGALSLFVYAAGFSYAYVRLDTATGALLLFACVQLSMIGVALVKGKTYRWSEWLGIGMACFGFLYLLLPGLSAPDGIGTGLMLLAGLAWATYTLLGAKSSSALQDTTGNFVRSLVFVAALLPFVPAIPINQNGLVLAVLSGALASGAGYAIWYKVLPQLSISVAAVGQLSVPLLAALGGLWLVNEALTVRLAIAGLLILSGILIVVLVNARNTPQPTEANPR